MKQETFTYNTINAKNWLANGIKCLGYFQKCHCDVTSVTKDTPITINLCVF